MLCYTVHLLWKWDRCMLVSVKWTLKLAKNVFWYAWVVEVIYSFFISYKLETKWIEYEHEWYDPWVSSVTNCVIYAVPALLLCHRFQLGRDNKQMPLGENWLSCQLGKHRLWLLNRSSRSGWYRTPEGHTKHTVLPKENQLFSFLIIFTISFCVNSSKNSAQFRDLNAPS